MELPNQLQQIENAKQMLEQYDHRIENEDLNLGSYTQFDFSFLQHLEIHKLTIWYCSDNVLLVSSTIKELDLSSCDITNIDELQLDNLEVLNVSMNKLTEIINIGRFKKLKSLDLSLNRHINLSGIQSLKNLEVLDIHLCYKVENFSLLTQLPSLKELNMREGYANLSVLKDMVQLTKLNVCNNQLEDINLLSSLINLEYLDICYNKIVDADPLKFLVKLTKLDISGLDLQNFSFLKSLKNLRKLGFTSQNKNYNQISDLVQLTKLHLECCDLNNINFLSSLKNLEYLNLHGNHGIDLTALQHLEKLSYLDIGGCYHRGCYHFCYTEEIPLAIDISPLKYVVTLKQLDLRYSELNSISALKHLVHLQQLNLEGNECLVDITPLQYLTQLNTLSLMSCNVYEISALRPLVNLVSLNLESKQTINLNPLNKLVKLTSLEVREADFKTIEDHPNFKELVLNKYMKESSDYVHISVRKMDTIDTGTTALRTNQTKYQSFKARYNLTKLQIDSLLQQQVRKQESFFNNIAQLFNILCEAFQ
ncbi:Conserved_hypothetical protein [Hexamita inflata]|uniref:Uncharacterized protein n=1 Tax=Hexamita inflata TaxID=28002 RepID=A0AA86N4S5_9EUKA|nr:Conserved hypothetical protein [Hexamita inflata]